MAAVDDLYRFFHFELIFLFGREDAYDVEHDQVAVMHCLERGLPNLGSFWLKRRRT